MNDYHLHELPTMNKKLKPTTLYLAINSIICCGLISQSIYAQEDTEVLKLPTIVITAEADSDQTEGSGSYKASTSRLSSKLNLSIKDTPQSVSVITREQIEQRNLNIIDDVLAATPGITVTKNDSERSNYFARGYSISNRQIDGLPIGENSPRVDSFFFDRIEVIKGAAGLSGATGNPSATINMVRKRPAKEFTGSVASSFSRWNTVRNEVDVSIPLNADGSVRSRVMAAHRDGDSYMDYYSLETLAAMAMLEGDFGEKMTASIGFQYQDNQPKGSTWGTVPYWNQDGSLANLPRNFSLANSWNTISQSDKTAFADLTYTFDNDWIIKASASHSLSKSFWLMSYGGSGFPNQNDGTGVGVWSTSYPTSESKKTSLELYASGPFQLFDREHELVVGANGFDRSTDSPSGKIDGIASNQLTCTKTVNGVTVPSNNLGDVCVINDWKTWDGNATTKPGYTVIAAAKDAKQRNYGVYTTLKLDVMDGLKLILGGRYSDYSATNGTKSDVETDAFTPYFGATYDINDAITTYASYTDMFNPSSNKDRNNSFLDPEIGKSYEAGIKANMFDDRLLATAAAFWSKKENVAIRDEEAILAKIKTDDGGDPMKASGEGLKIEGFEIEAIGQVAPDWNVTAGYTYVNSISSDVVQASTTIPQNIVKLYTNFKLPEQLWEGANQFNIGFGVNWQSEVASKSSSAPKNTDGYVRQDSYFLANANIGYTFSDALSANLQVNNLFDEKYYQQVGFYNGVYWGEPRNVILSLRAKF